MCIAHFLGLYLNIYTEILKILLRNDQLCDDVDISDIAQKTETFSGSDLKRKSHSICPKSPAISHFAIRPLRVRGSRCSEREGRFALEHTEYHIATTDGKHSDCTY